MKKQTIIVIIFLAVIAFFSGNHFFSRKNYNSAEVGGHKFKLELAVAKDEKKRGLGNRESLCGDCGMLFVFPEKGIYPFWMKNMNFDLDIIWIGDGKIVYIAKNVAHNSLVTIKPERAADRVLEINSGLSDKYGLVEGEKVFFSY